MHFAHPIYLLLALPALAWIFWLAWKTDVQIAAWRRWTALVLRTVICFALVFAIAGVQWMLPVEGMNVFFVLDRSDSVPSNQQDAAKALVNRMADLKKRDDKAGVIIFGTDASIDRMPNEKIDLEKVEAVVDTQRSDLASAIRLATAAFAETGQKRIVLMSDGNENLGDVMAAVAGAKAQGASVDVVPLGVTRGNDVFVQKVQVPTKLKKGQPFEAKIFVQADKAQKASVRLYRNEQFLGEQTVELEAGKNLFSFPQTLPEQGFFNYDVRVDAVGDALPQNNRATAFASVKGDPRVLLISGEPDQDETLAAALRSAKLDVKVVGLNGLPNSLAEMDSYDSIFISNLSAGDLGRDTMSLLEAAVRDFGVGLVCVGGENSYAAGGYRNTPLETTLPVSMELDSKKVLPPGAVVLVMHGMEFANGNQVARDCALGVLGALGPADEMGVILWDGVERWVYELQKVGNKSAAGSAIAGMNQGDLGSFQGVLEESHKALKASKASLKHIIVFSDGDPAPPSQELMNQIVNDRITVSTVLIAGHVGPQTMEWIADNGRGRFYLVNNPSQLPQIFIKETAVILKSAIYEEPFKPQVRSASEVTRGIGGADYPQLLGYVATSLKPRAETPLLTHKGDPLLAHWQYGLGRAVAFTSDARAKWGRNWLNWERYRQFWSQIAQWSLRRIENADFTSEVIVDKGEGVINVEALDEKGDYRNFLNLQAAVVSPKGERMTVKLVQTGPGHYEAKFPTKEVGGYLLNLMQVEHGEAVAGQVVGASVNFSPEFAAGEPNTSLLRRLSEVSGGRLLDPSRPGTDNPFTHDRIKTRRPLDLWEWLLKLAVILFVFDVGVRRIDLDRDEWAKVTSTLRKYLLFWKGSPRLVETEESLATLLARRDQVRGGRTAAGTAEARPDLFKPEQQPAPNVIFGPSEDSTASAAPITLPEPTKPAAEDKPGGTTSRLLEAKRRAQKRRDG
ncbi:MAG TPA: VWA domain-containing protein [Verrucomicrobiae bacterium]|nr:VWA domain-containing protein [Verrucomicrobiae bacterium]